MASGRTGRCNAAVPVERLEERSGHSLDVVGATKLALPASPRRSRASPSGTAARIGVSEARCSYVFPGTIVARTPGGRLCIGRSCALRGAPDAPEVDGRSTVPSGVEESTLLPAPAALTTMRLWTSRCTNLRGAAPPSSHRARSRAGSTRRRE